MEHDELLYWCLAAYFIGCMVAAILIEWINEIQTYSGDEAKMIPPTKALFSWCWVLMCLVIFINTYFTRK